MYGVDSHAFLIDREIVFTLYAISIVANPDIVTPQAVNPTQAGSTNANLNGVEKAFYNLNPDLK